ncbi:serine/threonine-protein kinase PITSLRE [Anopheles moucheti]|uniref:serine/threonine-protein kinase PITSLRE n=1 Tax=Anopheles moucheti TaxID=186751 RepID=UPI0022F0F0CE|nr:serine/threonine-protein kinase PITSLRE [Anopheles moucheti]
MSDAEQSEDGQVMSGVELSPSDDEETTDSLDIKPPQASSAYYGMSKRKDKKAKDRRHAKEQQHLRHHMMTERESDRDRERGDRRADRGSNRMEREQYYREREREHPASGREQHRHSGQGSSSRTGGSSGRDRSGGSRDTSNREKHHSSRYEMNPFYGELRETYHSKRERDRDREREHRVERSERDREREREYSEKQRRTAEEKATDPEKIMEDLRTRLLHKKNRRDSKRGDGREREHREVHQEPEMHPEEAEYYAEKREHRRREQHPHRRHREEEDGNDVRERERDRARHHGERRRAAEVVEILESPEHHHYQHHHHNPAQQPQQPSNVPRTAEEKEQDERRAKLLEADREMLRRKELAREELEARRLRKEEERGRGSESESHSEEESDEDEDEDGDVEEEEHPYEDDDVEMVAGDERAEDRRTTGKRSAKRRGDRGRERTRHRHRRGSSQSPTSSSHDSADSDAREEDEEHPPESPLSVGDLAKSDRRNSDSYRDSQSRSITNSRGGSESGSRSRSRSPRRHRRHEARDSRSSRSSRSHSREPEAKKHPGEGDDNGNDERKPSGDGEKASADVTQEVEVKDTLPPYFPGIQGCRSVEEFLCLNRIEEGTYGVVYRARDKRTEEIVALKRLKMEKEKEGFPITSLREINTLLKGQHPNIVTVREIVVGSNMDKIFIVMDYVEHDLKSLMETMKHKKQVFLPGEVKCLTQQLLRAVAHLHDNWILHRDLKTSNLLLSHKGILKVGDFGLAREYGSPLKPYTSIVVTLWYRAPELLLCCKEYSTPIDIWSVGCIFAEFLSMAALFPGKTEIDQLNRIFKDLGTPNEKIWPGYNELPAVQKMTFTEYPVSNLRKKFSHLTSELGISLLQGLLTFDPKQRLTAEVALQHNYFKELPLPIDPAMFPTWPAKSELGLKKALASSPKPPSGGGEFKKLGDDAVPDNAGFHLGGTTYAEARQLAMGPGFSLKF